LIGCRVPAKKTGDYCFSDPLRGTLKHSHLFLPHALTLYSYLIPYTLTLSLLTLLIIASLRYPCLHYTINVGRVYSTVRRGTILLFFRSVNASVMSVIATMSYSSYFVGYCDRLFVFIVEYSKFSLSFFYSLEMSSSLIASLPVFYTSCKVYKPADDFPRNRNGVPYKTCKACKVYRSIFICDSTPANLL
jgi:hypothetical protein